MPLSPLRLATDGSAPRLATLAALEDDGTTLRVEIEATDPAPWGTITARDGDLWTEEVVELFLAPGEETPRQYFEFEVNPLGTLFDARVDSPHGNRRSISVDRSWSCHGLEVRIEIDPDRRLWRTELDIPWTSVAADPVSDRWRLNICRIDRPRDAAPEFSAWSPTRATPADFHRPGRFGILVRVG